MMSESGEECELQQLVPPSEEGKSGEVTPPDNPGGKATLPSPATNKDKITIGIRTGGGSIPGTTASQGSITGSRSLIRISTEPKMGTPSIATPVTGGSIPGSQPTRLLYVNEKFSRGPSLMSDNSSRPPRDQRHNAPSSRLHNKKREPGMQQRTVEHHSFISDVADVRKMETALLQLLEDFHSGKLRAFGKDCSMEQMTGIREQQERLARLHFDLGAQQELFAPLSDEGLRADTENKHRLMDSLEQLSLSIEQLHSFSSDSREASLQPQD